MGHQLTFADGEFNHKRRRTRKEQFLGRMEGLIPWDRLGSNHRAVPSRGGQWPPSFSVDDHAADSLSAAVVPVE
jgi:IS5 family transposase